MFLLKKKNIWGLILCTLVLSASIPMLLGIEATPRAVFGGDMVALSQVDSSQSLDASLVADLKDQPNVEAASAEISCFSVINNFPVVIRGVNLDDFLEIENSSLIRGQVDNPGSFAVIGKKLAQKIHLDVGERFLMTGSSSPAVFQMEIDAVYEGRYSEDEMLVPLDYARKMAGLTGDSVLFIRVKTNNQTALVEDLEESEASVVVTDSSGLVTPVNSDLTDEERAEQQLAIQYLDMGQFKASNGSYVSLFVQEGTNSIKVVVGTFIVLDGALAFIGSAAIISRAIIERRNEMGIISAIGADRNHLRIMIVRDILILSVLASLTGVILGYILVVFIEDQGWLLMFGETVHAVINPYIVVGIFGVSVLIQTLSGLVMGNMMTKARPKSLMQETEKMFREGDAPSLDSVLNVEAAPEIMEEFGQEAVT
ncbi:MAG: FtsX-like permease family protein [Thermoplasmata archaeon]|nr:FtsX-like permease family protein [Thermoplasmata archaeon]